MITLKDINKSIISQVKAGLTNTSYSSVDFSSTDIKKSIIRPSFYLEFSSNKTGAFNFCNKERTIEAKIYYFPTDRYKYKIELIEIQSNLENIFFKYLKVNEEFYIYIEELEFDITDGILICSMELYSIEDISNETFENTIQSTENDNNELMEELEVN